MKEPFSDEILSAYIDGELSPRERGEVENWLETSSAAREKLDDFRRLSSLFDGLPRADVPPEFPTTVLQLAERRMLLPESRVVSAGVLSTRVVSARRRIGRWVLAGGVSIASAAVLFLIVSLALRDPGGRNAERAGNLRPAPVDLASGDLASRDLASGDNPGGRQEHFEREDFENVQLNDARQTDSRQNGAAVAQRDSDRKNADRSGSFRAPDAQNGPGGGGAAAPAAAPAVAGAASSPSPAQGMRRAGKKSLAKASTPSGVGGPLAKDATELPQLAEFNRSIHDLRERDGKQELVSVVKLYVADRAEGMVLLQNIFTDNEVPSDGEVESLAADGTIRKAVAREQPTATDGSEALYVVAELEQLIAAFTAVLSREGSTVRMTVDEPIEIAALDADVQKQLKELAPDLAGSRGLRRAIVAEESIARDKVQEPGADKSAADDAPASAVPAPDAPKDRAKSDAKPGEKLAENKSAARGGSPPPSAEKRSAALRPTDPGKPEMKSGAKKTGAKEAADIETGRSRQLVVPMPEALRRRAEQAEQKQPTERDSSSGEKEAAPAREVGRDEKAKAPAEDEDAAREPSLVRVLILIEPEPARPAAPATPASDK